jgi:membrane protease YdiL (CAAX protease family)
MSESISVAASSSQSFSSQRPLLFVAWAIVLLTTLPEIILRGFMQMDTPWMLPTRIGVLAVLFALTFAGSVIRPLRGLALVFLVIFIFENWFFGPVVQQSQFFRDIFGGNVNTAFFGERLMRIPAVLVMLLVLLGMGLKRRDFFLVVGDLKATAESGGRWWIPSKPVPWTRFGRDFALISVGLILLFIIPAAQPSLSNFSVGLVLFAALCAAMNAFAEEFLYRSALLPQVLPLFGKSMSLLLVAVWFGLGHYLGGVPGGIAGVLFTGIGGWVFAKSMVETRGMMWAWFLHFLADFTVYTVILLAGGF